MSVTSILICVLCMIDLGKSIPPSLCFEPFNFEDCGRRPLHVLYYYKPGSRCEVAIWRGCPTRNMFKDEYECINTCIFVERAKPEDYHNFGIEDDYLMQLNYGEVNDTIEDLEGTTFAGDDSPGNDGEDATEAGSSETGGGDATAGGESEGDGAGTAEGEGDAGSAANGEPGGGEEPPATEAPKEEDPSTSDSTNISN